MARIFILPWPMAALRFLYHLPKTLALILRLLKDPRVPTRLKLLPYFGLLYTVLPFDLLRDFPLVYLGFWDDLIVNFLVLRAFIRRCPEEVVREHMRALSKKPES